MWDYFVDILLLNEASIASSKKAKVNPLGIFVVTGFIAMSVHLGMSYLMPNRDSDKLLDLQSKLDGIAEAARASDFEQNRAAVQLSEELSGTYRDGFARAIEDNSKLNKQLEKLQNEFDTKNAEWKECGYPGALDSHRN